MTNQKKGWHCPVCPQTSSRRWNLEVHIRRKHLDSGAGVKPIWQESYSANNLDDRRTNNDSPVDRQGHSVLYPAIEWLIGQYQQDKKEEQKIRRKESERAAERDAFEHYLIAKTINQLQNHSGEAGNGFGNLSNLIPPLLATGNIVLVQTIDTNGNIVFRYELGNLSNAVAPMGTAENSLSNPVVVEMFRKIVEALDKRNEIIMQIIEGRGKGDGQEREMGQKNKPFDQCLGGKRSPSNFVGLEGQGGKSQQMMPQQDLTNQQPPQHEYKPHHELISQEEQEYVDGIRRMLENQKKEREHQKRNGVLTDNYTSRHLP
jgi:hypothetical protein